jgi:hypothetical protein
MPLRETLSNTWSHIQGFLFPMLREELGPLTDQHRRVIVVLDAAGIEAFIQMWPGLPGRPPSDRHALARAFVAKAVLGVPQTSMLIERLKVDKVLRRLCGWERASQVPSESTFSRAFSEFAASQLPARVHEALIKKTHADRLAGDASASPLFGLEQAPSGAAISPATRPQSRRAKSRPAPKRPRRQSRSASAAGLGRARRGSRRDVWSARHS